MLRLSQIGFRKDIILLKTVPNDLTLLPFDRKSMTVSISLFVS